MVQKHRKPTGLPFHPSLADILAYEAAGVPKSRTWVISGGGAESWLGKDSAGARGSQKVVDWTRHLAFDVLEQPDASPAIPYVDLWWSERPTHQGLDASRKEKKEEQARQATTTMAEVTD